MMMWIVIFLLILFRWWLLERLIGTANMFLFDALMFTFLAAINFAQPGPYPWLGYVIGGLCAYWAFSAARTFMHYGQKETEDEQGRSDE